MGTDKIVEMVALGLFALLQHAPEVAAALTGGQSVQEAVDAARAAAAKLPVRTGPGGTWTRDLDERLRRDDGKIDPSRD